MYNFLPTHGDLMSNIKNCQMFYFRSMQCPDEETNALRRLWIHNKHWKMKEKERKTTSGETFYLCADK